LLADYLLSKSKNFLYVDLDLIIPKIIDTTNNNNHNTISDSPTQPPRDLNNSAMLGGGHLTLGIGHHDRARTSINSAKLHKDRADYLEERKAGSAMNGSL
jgi:hypothetical protein